MTSSPSHRDDEVWRQVVALTARIIEAQTLDVKALGKGRREILERTVSELRQAALGDPEVAYAGRRYLADELRVLRGEIGP